MFGAPAPNIPTTLQDIQQRDEINTRLLKAAETGDHIMVTALLKNGANPDHLEIRSAGLAGNSHNVITVKPLNVEVTPLSLAAENGHVNVIRALITQGAEIDKVLKKDRELGNIPFRRTALIVALLQKQESAAIALIEAGSNVNFDEYQVAERYTFLTREPYLFSKPAIFLAIENRMSAILIQSFVNHGANLQQKVPYLRPLQFWIPIYAISVFSLGLPVLLLACCTSDNPEDCSAAVNYRYFTPLELARNKNHTEAIHALENANTNPLQLTQPTGMTMLAPPPQQDRATAGMSPV
jgi:ankyrin repeat protein